MYCMEREWRITGSTDEFRMDDISHKMRFVVLSALVKKEAGLLELVLSIRELSSKAVNLNNFCVI